MTSTVRRGVVVGSGAALLAAPLISAAAQDAAGVLEWGGYRRRGGGAGNGETMRRDSDAFEKPFAGVSINVLGRSFGHDYFMTKVREWEDMTGAAVSVPRVATSGSELNELTWEDMSTGANYYDGYIATNQNVPSLASMGGKGPGTGGGDGDREQRPWIKNLDEDVKNSRDLDWPGIHGTFRENLCLYDNHIYTLPFDGDQFFLYYRRDLQEKDGWTVPKTWDDLVEVAERYRGADLNGDGEEDYAVCQPNKGDMAFYSIYSPLAALLQTHPKYHPDVKDRIYPTRHGAFFDLIEGGLAPLVNNAAMRRVLPLMRRLYDLGRREKLDLCCGETNSGHGLFKAGRCAFYVSFPSVGTNSISTTVGKQGNDTVLAYQHGRTGTAEMPGWTEYYDRESDELRPCTPEACPAAVPLDGDDDEAGGGGGADDGGGTATTTTQRWLNRASFFANGGMGSVINGRVSDLRQRAAFSLFAFFSKNLDTTQAGVPYNPFRVPKHFQLEDYLASGWNRTDAELYLDAAQKSLDNENAVIDLRVPYALASKREGKDGFFRLYVHHLNRFYKMSEAGDPDAVEKTITRLDRDVREWIVDHDTRVASSETFWTGTIEAIYRRGMGLPLRASPITVNYHSIEQFRWFGWVLAAVILLTSIGFAGWVIRKRKTRLVRASQPIFLLMITAGSFLMGASLIPLGIDDTIASAHGCSIACMSWPWLFTCGFTVSFSALLSKELRINKIFHYPQFRRIKVSAKDVMIPFITLLMLNVTVLSTWTLLDPLVWERVEVDALNSYGRCAPAGEGTASNACLALIITINAVALIAANLQAYRARTISDEFSESKYIGIAMLAILQMAFFSFPVAFLVKNTPSARYFVYSSIIFVISMSLLLLVFVHKVRLMKQMGHPGQTETRTFFRLGLLAKSSSGAQVKISAYDMGSFSRKNESSRSSSGSIGVKVIRSSPPDMETSRPTDGETDLRRRSSLFHRARSLRQSTGFLGIRVKRGSHHDAGIQKTELELNQMKHSVDALRSILQEMGVDADAAFHEAGLADHIDEAAHAEGPSESMHELLGAPAAKRPNSRASCVQFSFLDRLKASEVEESGHQVEDQLDEFVDEQSVSEREMTPTNRKCALSLPVGEECIQKVLSSQVQEQQSEIEPVQLT